jgi:hypothetical protein
VRFVIAGSLLYGFLRWRGAPAPTWAQWRAAGRSSFCCSVAATAA